MSQGPPLRILFLLSYYRPHISGLTIYVQRLAEGLAARGLRTTVLTSRYDRSLPRNESINGVEIHRVPVWFWLSKGAIMPGYLPALLPRMREADVVVTNLPNTPIELAAAVIARFGVRRPFIATFHCDVQLPPGTFNRFVDRGVALFNRLTIRLADRVVTYTRDYASHSPVVSRFLTKCVQIAPPVLAPVVSDTDVRKFRSMHCREGEVLVGFAARFATEKGVEYAVEALRQLQNEDRVGPVRILFAGEHQNVLGETGYRRMLQDRIDALGDRWRFLGVLQPDEMSVFFAACDVTILPSINSTESFGLVQVESMLCGTPVIASNLPGIRVPVRTTGMGKIIPACDGTALAEAIVEVAANRDAFVRNRREIERSFSLAETLQSYEQLFRNLAVEVKTGKQPGSQG